MAELRTRMFGSPLSVDMRKGFTPLTRAVSVLWLGLKPDWTVSEVIGGQV